MADIVPSLFGITPELYQQAQAQRASEQALQFAQLDPFQKASFGIGRGAYQLAGALGGTDPQLQMISTRNSIARQINYNDPNSIMQGVQMLNQAGDTVGAMQLADEARKREGQMAQTFQRTAAGQASLAAANRERQQATPEKIQLARELALAKGQPGTPEFASEYNSQLTRLTTTSSTAATPEKIQLARELAAQAGEPGSPEYTAAYRTELTRLTTTERPEAMTPEMRNAAALASLKGAPGSPEFNAEYSAQLGRLTTKAEGREPTTPELTNARALALRAGPVGSPEYNAAFDAEYARLTAPKDTKEPTTAELTNARAVASRAGAAGSPEYNAAFDAEYRRLTAPKDVKEPTTAELTNARAIALQAGPVASPEYNAAFMREYNRLTAPKDTQVSDAIRQYEYAKTPAGGGFKGTFEDWRKTSGQKIEVRNIMPGDNKLADIPAFRKQVQATIEPQLKAINSADQALQAIRDSLATNNFVSFNAARVQLAKSLGDSQLSRRDVEQAGGDPSILGGLFDAASRLFSGTPTADTQKKIRDTLTAIRTVAARKAQAEVDVQLGIALGSPGYDEVKVRRALDFPELRAAPSAAGGGSLAERAAAELARRKEKK